MKNFYKTMLNVYVGAAIIALASAGIFLARFFLGNLSIEKAILFSGLLFITGIYAAIKSIWFYNEIKKL